MYNSKNEYTVLDAVTVATARTSLSIGLAKTVTVNVLVSGNTGAVTTTIEGSYDGGTTWYTLDATTKTATNVNYEAYHKDGTTLTHVAAKTTSHSNATVSVKVSIGA